MSRWPSILWKPIIGDGCTRMRSTSSTVRRGLVKVPCILSLIARADELFDRQVILAPAENPRGAPAFQDLVTNPPASEREFVGLWKLYFACLASAAFDDLGISGAAASQLRAHLEREDLVKGKRTLQGLLRGVVDYVRSAIRPATIEAGIEVDPHSQLPTGFSGKISFHEPDATAVKSGVASVDELLRLCDVSLHEAGYSFVANARSLGRSLCGEPRA